jgi:hypothetical protein
MSYQGVSIQRVGIIEESPGVKSSKRFWGSILLAAGGLLILALGIYSFFHVAADPETVKGCGIALIVVGGGLLGITVFEGISDAIGKAVARRVSNASAQEAGQ